LSPRCNRRELARPVAAARERTHDQREQAGHAFLRRRQVGDVLARERFLIGLRAHVTRVDAVHAQVRLLGREYRRQLLEGCLRGAVSAPALVRLDRRVRRDVEDGRAGHKSRERFLHERQRREDVHLVDAREL
jgi:hypothetical protein